MAYFLPQVEVFQEFEDLADGIVDPLRACIVGPLAELFRYSESSEKTDTALGAYDPDVDTDYEWPNRPTGGIPDQDYAKLWADDVLLQYFADLVGVDSTVTPVSGKTNQVTSDAVNFKENIVGATTYARDAALLDRDVAVGDTVDLRATVMAVEYNLRTSVKGFVGDPVAATIDTGVSGGTPTNDSNNAATQAADDTVAQSAGPYNCVSATADSTSYDGTVDGNINETYTVTVTDGSIDGDHTTAKLRVTSASEDDDAVDVVPAAEGLPTAIGANGLELTFSVSSASSCSYSAGEQGVSDDDLLAGQTWVVSVEQVFTAPTVSSAGSSYSLEYDTSYIVEVTRGGPFAGSNKPQITVSTLHGVDTSGPTNVTAAATAVAVGTGGVQIAFSGVTNLRKGDIFYVVVVAEQEGPMRTLILTNNLPEGMEGATDMDLTLYIAKDGIEIPRKRQGAAPLVNYDLGDSGDEDTGFTVKSGITAFDPTWTDGGVEQPLDMVEADLFMEYRAWLPDVCDKVYTIGVDGEMDDIPGPSHPDNPLKWGVLNARNNANGTAVKYLGVCNPDDNGEWEDAIDLLVGVPDIYNIVPMTTDTLLLLLFSAHIESQSGPTLGLERAGFFNLTADATESQVDDTSTTDLGVSLAKVGDDTDIAGDQWVIVTVPAGNAQFETNGVKPGDIMRYNFSTDGWGDESYDEYVIDQVTNEDTLRLKTGQGTIEVTVAKKMEVWRNLDAAELADQISGKAAVFASRRIVTLWPDTVGSGGLTFPGYHLCAALAGLRSGVAPNQGLTNMQISGFDDLSRTHDLFNGTQLNTMAESGVWIVTENDDQVVITRHALNSIAADDVLQDEEMVRVNVDSMAKVFRSSVEDLIGVSNVTPSTLDLIELRLKGVIEQFKEIRIERIGGQLIEGEILEVRQHAVLKDRVVADLELTVPVPLNNLEIHLKIIA
jgi:hypothetical protein